MREKVDGDHAGQVLIDMRPITPVVLLIKARCVIDGSQMVENAHDTPGCWQSAMSQCTEPVGASIFPDTC